MTNIDENTVARLAELAKLRLDEEEKTRLTGDLAAMVKLFTELSDGQEDITENDRLITRPDEAHKAPEDVMSTALEVREGCIAVPRTFAGTNG